MKFKRLISGAAVAAIVVSSFSFSASANPNAKPGEIGFETGQSRMDSDDFDFMQQPYSLTSGDYYMGLSVQTGAFTHRNAIGDTGGDNGQRIMNKNKQFIDGINKLCEWAHLYSGGYALIDRDANGVALSSSHAAYGPTGLYYGENEGESGIKEYAQLHDVKIGDSGTYTVGIQGYNFKVDSATNYDGDYGNGISILYITSNIGKEAGVTISNPVLKLYNTKEEYEKKTPYKTISTDYWVTGFTKETGYASYTFTNIWRRNGEKADETGEIINIDKKYTNNDNCLDAFQISGYTGNASSQFTKTKFEGCQFLPEYGMEITFNVNVPDNSAEKVVSKPLENVLAEVSKIINDEGSIAAVQAKNPSMTIDQIKEKLVTAYNTAKGVYDKYGNFKSLSKSLITEAQAALDKAVSDLKAICSQFGILIWGELNGYIETAEGLDFTKYTEKSWKALEKAIKEAKNLVERNANGENITQAQIDAATAKLKAAIDNLKEVSGKAKNSAGYGYLQFKDKSGKYQWYNDGKNYRNVNAKTVKVVTSDKGNGKTYTVKAKCDGKAKGLADCDLEIQGLLKKHENATVTVNEVKLDGKKQKLTGVPYNLAVDETNINVPLYDSEVTSIPEGAYTSTDGKCAKDASPQALSKGAKDDYAAIGKEWKEITVKFTVNWGDTATTESASNGENNSENPDTAGGAAIAASLMVVIGAGYVVSRKRKR